MTQTDIQISDRTSVPPKADVRVVVAAPPAATATTNSDVAKDGRGAPALTGKPSLGVSSLDLPAASSGVAGLSTDDISKNSMTFRVAAASETISNSTSSVGA
ncbi:hypothetical protein RPMA_12300 [Tardiphaga alba]|uniref:Uncharacterized protein n=1 Tax=Tardiphaga alba TaxID=340268 RepID=A0ABX8AAT2_9BRAD|nr:hypothetical protein [Tardiphaga alba]QUS39528.1 hypothetical protein RPMA_12300 [Tardiphaga alba]